jgi:hypothetical protein
MRWLVTLLLGAVGGYLASRVATRSELDEFQQELRSVEKSARDRHVPSGPQAEPTPQAEGIDPTRVMLIGAAVAAYLGKHAVVRRIRVVGHRGGDPWALSGRATLQASHNVVQTHR